MNKPTPSQLRIAREEARNITREYLENRDESELEEAIYEAIVEALKAQKNV